MSQIPDLQDFDVGKLDDHYYFDLKALKNFDKHLDGLQKHLKTICASYSGGESLCGDEDGDSHSKIGFYIMQMRLMTIF